MFNVLSLFDGMSCGQIALDKLGIKVDNYYASEIDKHSMEVTKHNYPNTIHIGDVTSLDLSKLPPIDLLIGGSPCQSFSVCGDGSGFDGKSKLFWDYVRVLKEVKPKYFLLENVKMKKQWEQIITDSLGVQPIEINSSKLSGQHRRRLYWTNIPNVKQPEDLGINLSSILDNSIVGEEIFGDIKASNGKTIRIERGKYPYTFYEARTEEGKAERRRIRLLTGKDSTPRSAKYKIYLPHYKSDKSNCIVSTPSQLDYIVDNNGKYRELDIIELERLQCLPDNYTSIASPRQRRKMVGNGWTISVIMNILKNINNE